MPKPITYTTEHGDTQIKLGQGHTSGRWGKLVNAEIRMPAGFDARPAVAGLLKLIDTGVEDEDFPVFAADVNKVDVPHSDAPNLVLMQFSTAHINTAEHRAGPDEHKAAAIDICQALADFVLNYDGSA